MCVDGGSCEWAMGHTTFASSGMSFQTRFAALFPGALVVHFLHTTGCACYVNKMQLPLHT